jgi:hypothetical protein
MVLRPIPYILLNIINQLKQKTKIYTKKRRSFNSSIYGKKSNPISTDKLIPNTLGLEKNFNIKELSSTEKSKKYITTIFDVNGQNGKSKGQGDFSIISAYKNSFK